MPLKVKINGVETWLKPKKEWQELDVKSDKPTLAVDKNFYIITSDITD